MPVEDAAVTERGILGDPEPSMGTSVTSELTAHRRGHVRRVPRLVESVVHYWDVSNAKAEITMWSGPSSQRRSDVLEAEGLDEFSTPPDQLELNRGLPLLRNGAG